MYFPCFLPKKAEALKPFAYSRRCQKVSNQSFTKKNMIDEVFILRHIFFINRQICIKNSVTMFVTELTLYYQ